MLESIDARNLRDVVVGYRDALRAHREKLNRLNVYPVPDGDTGTNMALTLESVVSELDGADDMGTTCKAISHGSLMGARGNSGVILSQVLRGMTDTIKGSDAVDGAALADALRTASEAAYKAVMRPVEGTILTVVRESATAAGAAAANGDNLDGVLEAASRAADDSLARTPELLPVLKDAGVVDAGAAGYVLLLDVLLHVEAALDAGRPRNIRVTDLLEQVEEERWVREAPPDEPAPPSEPVPTAVVAVATGDGIRRIFHSLGVHQIVAGGQSMNPATAQILEAIEAAPADQVLVLPNNKNIIPVAEQVDALTSKQV